VPDPDVLSADCRAAARFTRHAAWVVLVWAVFWGALTGLSVLAAVVWLWPSGRPQLALYAEALGWPAGATLLLGIAALLVEYVAAPKVTGDLAGREIASSVDSARDCLAGCLLFSICFFPLTISVSELSWVATTISFFPFTVFVWKLWLAHFCRKAGEHCGSDALQGRAKLALRNWWFVLAEAAGLFCMGMLLAELPMWPVFGPVLLLLFFPFPAYASIQLLTVLRMTAKVLDRAADTAPTTPAEQESDA